jgi:predicted dinucleotide-binding enzyme
MDKDPEKSAKLHTSVIYFSPSADVEVVDCAYESSWEADIIIPAIQNQEQQSLAEKIRAVVTGKIVIRIDFVMDPYGTAEELQKLLPYSKIVKILSTDFSNPSLEVVITGDDESAVEAVFQLMEDAGFNPLAGGKLSANATAEK